MDDEKALCEAVFGESSESEVEVSPDGVTQLTQEHGKGRWDGIDGIKGLWLCRDFLSPSQQASLLSSIEDEDSDLSLKLASALVASAQLAVAMRFGDLPAWARELSDSIRELILQSGSGLDVMDFENFLGDEETGEGICAHVDLLRFEDGIAIVSLESSCVMHFTRVESTGCDIEDGGKFYPATRKVPVLLTPGSLVLMSREARYLWKHEINRKPGFQMWEGQELTQKRRVSITLRKLCPAEQGDKSK